jgi:hypothetical protein
MEAEAQVKAKTKVVEALKKQLKEQADTLSQVTKYSLQRREAAATNAGCPPDVEGIRVNAWRVKKEKQAARSKVFFNRDDRQLAAKAAGEAGVITAAAVAAPLDRKAWENSIGVKLANFKANHKLGRLASKARIAAQRGGEAGKDCFADCSFGQQTE